MARIQKRRKKANAAKRKGKSIAYLIRELERKLPEGELQELELYKKVLTQEQNSKNKI
ncbi:MAG: hypothetical protein OIF50_11580 [Flavobacteriaceae bacterium]|nr:hypothetical protein [Flavobacteriaceae bacterium]